MIEQPTLETITAPSDHKVGKRILFYRLLWLLDHWVLVFTLLFGIFIFLPFLAPVLMRMGWIGPANIIYTVYGTQCHQMAQRSFFLFGAQPMYNISQLPLQINGDEVANMLALRAFVGNAGLGWKVAWSDRMVYIYGAMWLTGIVFGLLRHRRNVRPLWLPAFFSLLLPMAVDGATHWLSDVTGGLVGGFRYDNGWLAHLTGNALPTWFYVGDALGSFNSSMRLITGLLFGVAVVWLVFPILDRSAHEAEMELRTKLWGYTSAAK